MFEFLSFVLVQFIFHCDYQAIDEGETVRIDGLQNKQVWPRQSRTSGGFTPRVLEHFLWYDRCHMNVSTGSHDSIAGLPGKEEAETFATSLPIDPGPDSSSIAEWHRDSHTVIESYVQPAGRQRPSIPELRVESVLQEHLSRMSWKSKGALCRKASWDHWCWTRRGSGGSTRRTYGSKSWVFWRSWRTSNWSTTNPWAAAPRSNGRSCSWRWGSLWIWCWSWTSGWRWGKRRCWFEICGSGKIWSRRVDDYGTGENLCGALLLTAANSHFFHVSIVKMTGGKVNRKWRT